MKNHTLMIASVLMSLSASAFASSADVGKKLCSTIKAEQELMDLRDVSIMRCSSISLQGANFQDADLTGVNLQGAVLQSVDFSGATLKDVNFEGASLISVNLDGASLTGANFKGTLFRNTEVQRSKE